MRRLLMTAAAVLVLGGPPAQAAVPPHIAAALEDTTRPDNERARDGARKPGELLAFAEVKVGQKVADLVMGSGYFTRVLAAAVGPKGHVTAYQPEEFIRFRASYGEDQRKVSGAYANVTPLTATFADLDLPEELDLVLTVQNYHDFHLTPFPKDTAAKVNAEVFRSLRPGGLYVIVDHAAVPGSGLEPAMTVHRIDPAIVRQEVEAVGFRFEGESPLLSDPFDPRTGNVFEPGIRGKTDQFVLKFRKPG